MGDNRDTLRLPEKVQKVPKRSDLPPIGRGASFSIQHFYGKGDALGLLPSDS